MKLEKMYQEIRDTVLAMEPDVKKVVAGNRAAGRRVRKGLQEMKKQAQALRLGISAQAKAE